MNDAPKRALILSGGGARAAYQAGVLRAMAQWLPAGSATPFAIVCGTSAGAINAAALAASANDIGLAAEKLCSVWSRLTVHDIYRAHASVAQTGWRWLRKRLHLGAPPRVTSLLDNSPLAALLEREIPFGAISKQIASGALEALAITASSYHSGMSVSFCMGTPAMEMWERSQRIGLRADIGVAHLMASSAIPFVFPPARIGEEFFGDGAMRQMAPTAPALHLGADRILMVGAARSGTRTAPATHTGPPSLAQIGSHVLASIFTDALGTDLEKVRLVNVAVRQIPQERLALSPMPLRDVMLEVLTPSVPLESLALKFKDRLPASVRLLLSRFGGTGTGGAGLLSYLLFDTEFCGSLIELGYHDAQARKNELLALIT